MTDERMGDVIGAVAALPRGAGVVFRHHATPVRDRRLLFLRVRQQARQRGLTLILADRPGVARAWGVAGAHHHGTHASQGLRTVAVHDRAELVQARRLNADLIFVSPVYATRSHPGARPLGRVRLGLLIGPMRERTIALGGMTETRFRGLNALGVHGWAAIDGLTPTTVRI